MRNEARYRHALARYIETQANPPDKLSHQPRVYALARRLAQGQPFDDDVLFAAAWLHDLGVFVGHRPEKPAELARWDHIAYAMKASPPLLRRFRFPAAKIPAVIEVIRTHLPLSQPTTFEGTLLREADILEQLGATGILRTAAKVGRDTRFVLFEAALAALRRNAERLPALLTLPAAHRVARQRVRVMRSFLAAAGGEESLLGA